MATNEVTLLLVGNTGNGKSATGNSILRQQVFKTTASTFSTKSEFGLASNSFQNININVVDGPGVNTDKSDEEVLNLSVENMKQALNLCNYRFSGLLIVLKYGTRFTKQENDFITFLKAILGGNVIRNFGVCIITHGDNFDADYGDNNLSFKEWCHLQEGEIQKLFQECNYRCVLFNNRTKDASLKNSQVSELLAMVPRNAHYSESNFRTADTDLQKLIIETKMPSILKDTNDFLEKCRKEIKNIQTYLDISKQIQSYNDVLNQVNEFEQKLVNRYHGPDNIQQPLNVMKIFKMDINVKLKNCEKTQQLQKEKALTESMKLPRRDQHPPLLTIPPLESNDFPTYRYHERGNQERVSLRDDYSNFRAPNTTARGTLDQETVELYRNKKFRILFLLLLFLLFFVFLFLESGL